MTPGSCITTKTAWPTQVEAVEALERIWANPHTKVVPKRAYRCPWCEQWHLTSHDLKPPSQARRNARRAHR